MKKVILGALLIVSVSLMARNYVYASATLPGKTGILKVSSTVVPGQVLANFNNMFPSTKALRWQVITGGYGFTNTLLNLDRMAQKEQRDLHRMALILEELNHS
jgi:hypothetical protein